MVLEHLQIGSIVDFKHVYLGWILAEVISISPRIISLPNVHGSKHRFQVNFHPVGYLCIHNQSVLPFHCVCPYKICELDCAGNVQFPGKKSSKWDMVPHRTVSSPFRSESSPFPTESSLFPSQSSPFPIQCGSIVDVRLINGTRSLWLPALEVYDYGEFANEYKIQLLENMNVPLLNVEKLDLSMANKQSQTMVENKENLRIQNKEKLIQNKENLHVTTKQFQKLASTQQVWLTPQDQEKELILHHSFIKPFRSRTGINDIVKGVIQLKDMIQLNSSYLKSVTNLKNLDRFQINGKYFEIGQFVYFRQSLNTPFRIGQITSTTEHTITLCNQAKETKLSETQQVEFEQVVYPEICECQRTTGCECGSNILSLQKHEKFTTNLFHKRKHWSLVLFLLFIVTLALVALWFISFPKPDPMHVNYAYSSYVSKVYH